MQVFPIVQIVVTALAAKRLGRTSAGNMVVSGMMLLSFNAPLLAGWRPPLPLLPPPRQAEPDADAEPAVVETDHYVVRVHGSTKKKHRLMPDLRPALAAAHEHLAAIFGHRDGAKLRVEIYHDVDLYNEVHQPTGLPEGSIATGGAYDVDENVVHAVYDHEGEREFVESLVHELAHQYHHNALWERGLLPPGERVASLVYVEAVAQLAADVHWVNDDAGDRLIAVERGHWPAEALHDFESWGWSVCRLAQMDDRFGTYPFARGFVSFLQDRHPEVYETWAASLDRGATPKEAWTASACETGLCETKLDDDFVAYLRERQDHLAETAGYAYATQEWQRRDGGGWWADIGYVSQGVVIPVEQALPWRHRFDEELGILTMPGYVFNYEGPRDYEIVRVMRTGAVHHEVVRDGVGQPFPNILGQVAGLDWRDDWRVGLAEDGGELVFSAAGQEAARFDRKPGTQVGLSLFGGRGTFAPVPD